MSKDKISDYSSTANSNTDIAGINIDEGCAPSGINDAIRTLMAQLKNFQQGTGGDSFNGPVGSTTASTGAFTTLTTTSTINGLTATYSLTVNTNGAISGYKLNSTGGTSTFIIRGSNDASNWTTLATLSVTGSGQNFSGSIVGNYRYIDLRANAFGTNGQANVDYFIVYQDGITSDYSGNGNSWSPSGISVTAGITYDSMIDSPTTYDDGSSYYNRGNYCTWNPLSSSSGTILEGNLYYYGPGSWLSKMGTMQLPQNSKIYFETTLNNAPYTPRGSTSSYNWIGVGLITNYGITQAPSGGSSS